MNTQLSEDELVITEAGKFLPSVSIILPFDIQIAAKSEAKRKLKVVVENVEKALKLNYSQDDAAPVISRLETLLDEIDYNLCKKSIAIFISPQVEKIFYLTIPVEEKIVIDESFDIRQLVFNKKEAVQYLVLLVSAEASKAYLNNGLSLSSLKMDVPVNAHAYENTSNERTGNFSDPSKYKEVLLDKMLHHADEGLTHLLKTYPYPVFVMGAARDLGHFKKITRNEKNIVHFVHGNFIEASEYEVQVALKPFIAALETSFQQHLLNKLAEANNNNKLAGGIKAVWQAAEASSIKLLVVEKNYVCPAYVYQDNLYPESELITNGRHTKDAVGDIIQKVLETGGDVEFINDSTLVTCERIAAIKYY
jgi:hypothetical protein